ncbi:UbiA prenyltransferase [Methanoregula boonei 6A8]|uniref:UbiA prenyltransferase n=1 Tax=Methanoregula boonei (strain DSM 21154 / JCM 14090 / 6A8) TaxID=456442 RepID=A7I9T4_METB6|nr:UbiA family prenyltransferase [Methanoregula boonei]ABS56495.1 UbiA prenyltransferase [Methanoregula boonei 6A8]
MSIFGNPTFRLLNSSTVVAIGGGLRLHIAFLLAGLAVQIPEYCACALIIYATYTLDRALDCKEDAINKPSLIGANGRIGILACIVAFLLGTFLFVRDGIYLAPFFPFIVGYIYTRGLQIGPYAFKLKGGAGIKNIIIGISWGGAIALVVSRYCGSIATVGVIFLFFGLKLFVTSCVNDFKDVRGDVAAGIHTLPAYLGENLTKKVLVIIIVALHIVMAYAVFFHVIQNEWIIIVYSFVITSSFLLVYSSSFEKSSLIICRRLREIVIYWESAITLVIRSCIMA